MTAAEFRRLRAAAGLSQAKLAAELGAAVRSVQYYETGRTIPSEVADRLRGLAAQAKKRTKKEQQP